MSLHRSLYRALIRAARPVDVYPSHRAALATSSFLRSYIPLSWFLSPDVASHHTCTSLVRSHFRAKTQGGISISTAFQTLRHLRVNPETPLAQALSRLQQSAWGTAVQHTLFNAHSNTNTSTASTSTSTGSTTTTCPCPAADELSCPNLIMVAATQEDSEDVTRITSLSPYSLTLTPQQRTRLAADTHLMHDVISCSHDTLVTLNPDELCGSTIPRLIMDLYNIMLAAGVRPDVDTLELLMLTSIHMAPSSSQPGAFSSQLVHDMHVMGLKLTLQLYNNYIFSLCHQQTDQPHSVLHNIASVMSDMTRAATPPDSATFVMLYQYACIHRLHTESLLSRVMDMAASYNITPNQIFMAMPPTQQQALQHWLAQAETGDRDRPTTSS